MKGHSTKYSRTKTASADLLLLFSKYSELVSDVNGVWSTGCEVSIRYTEA